MPYTPQQIKATIISLLQEKPEGMRHTEIFRGVKERFPDAPRGAIVGKIRWAQRDPKSGVERLSRGLYRHIKYRNTEEAVGEQKQDQQNSVGNESDFYQPFADYLMEELGECTKAIVLGGNRFGGKWGTPDVIGVNKSYEFERIRHETVIVSAEIKIRTDGQSLIIAFGQACAYRLFSHKVYIVIPDTSPQEDIDRVESLCLIFGIGLILFDPADLSIETFKIRTRATKHEPDFSYVNENVEEIAEDLLRD